MKITVKTVYIVTSVNGKDVEEETMQEAESTKQFLEDVTGLSFAIHKRQKEIYKIEKGDKVQLAGIAGRIDIVTGVITDAWGDVRYKTKEINGNKRGIAYRKDLIPVL